MAKDNTTKGKMGRPTKWEDTMVERAYKLALIGLTDEELATAFGVAIQTWNDWKRDKPDLSEALKEGKTIADAKVVQSLYKRACGYEYKEVISNLKSSDKEGEPVAVVKKITTKEVAPDTTACIFWLKNRQRQYWTDVNKHEHTGKDGKPISHTHTNKLPKITSEDLKDFTDEELALAAKIGFMAIDKTKDE